MANTAIDADTQRVIHRTLRIHHQNLVVGGEVRGRGRNPGKEMAQCVGFPECRQNDGKLAVV
jgi:hypothetical protein